MSSLLYAVAKQRLLLGHSESLRKEIFRAHTPSPSQLFKLRSRSLAQAGMHGQVYLAQFDRGWEVTPHILDVLDCSIRNRQVNLASNSPKQTLIQVCDFKKKKTPEMGWVNWDCPPKCLSISALKSYHSPGIPARSQQRVSRSVSAHSLTHTKCFLVLLIFIPILSLLRFFNSLIR